MSAILDFPPLLGDQPKDDAAELLDIAEIRDGNAIVKLSRTEAGLAELRADLLGKAYDLATTKGDTQARADRLRCVTLRTSVEKLRKALKAPALDFGRRIDSEAQRITAEVEKLEAPIDFAIRADEKRRADEKAARERAEQERLRALRDTVDQMLLKWSARCHADGITADRIDSGIAGFKLMVMPAELADVAGHWAQQHAATLVKMVDARDACARREAAARLEEQRLENERIAADQRAEAAEIARQRAELEAAAAAQRAEAKRLEDEREALAKQQQAFAGVIDPEPVAVAPIAQGGVAENPVQPQPVHPSAGDVAAEDEAVAIHQAEACATAPSVTDPRAALLAHIDVAFTGRFPAHPKPDQTWWATLRTLADNCKTNP